jgi:hypothetical protein
MGAQTTIRQNGLSRWIGHCPYLTILLAVLAAAALVPGFFGAGESGTVQYNCQLVT